MSPNPHKVPMDIYFADSGIQGVDVLSTGPPEEWPNLPFAMPGLWGWNGLRVVHSPK